MKNRRHLTALSAGILLAACGGTNASSQHRGVQGPYPPGGSYGPRHQGPYAMPHRPASAPPPPGAGWMPAPAPAASVPRSINLAGLLASLAQSPCAPVEVSPGNWVGMDCSLPTLIARATPFFTPKSFITGTLPLSVDHRTIGMEGPVKSQGSVGTCTAMSLSTAMEHALRRYGVGDNVSALHIWSQYRVPRMGTAGDATMDKRITSSNAWPYDPAVACKMIQRPSDSCAVAYGVLPGTADTDPQIVAGKQHADSTGRYRLVGIEKMRSHDPNQIAAVLAGGDDLWVAFNMNTEAWKSRNMVNHVIQDYVPSRSSGHAVVLSGYRTVGMQKQFLVHNSWGERWGDRGYAWISENMVRSQMRYAYRVQVADPKGPQPNPGPGPAPSPPVQPGACPTGQAMDLIYRRCVPACATGAPPAAGLCAPPVPGWTPPAPSPAPSGTSCPPGKATDLLTGQCAPSCAGGTPSIGGMCLPRL